MHLVAIAALTLSAPTLPTALATEDPPPVPVELEAFQRTWIAADGAAIQPFSNHGELGITTPPIDPEVTLWFNASVEGSWSIRNLSLLSGTDLDEPVTLWARFPLPMPPELHFGVPVEKVTLAWSLTTEPLPFFEGGLETTLLVTPSFYYAGDDGPPEKEPVPELPEFSPGASVTVDRSFDGPCETVARPDLPGVSEDVQRCAPGASARCLSWLTTRLGIELPDDCSTPQQIYEKLDALMGQTAFGGTANYGLHGIAAFLEEKGLDKCFSVTLRRYSEPDPPTPSDMFDAMKRGYDVVVLFGWWTRNADGELVRVNGHQGTAAEIKRCGDQYQFKYRDDTEPGNGQGDGEPDRGYRKATLRSYDEDEIPDSWWIPEEGVDPETGQARSFRWEGFIQICPSRLKLAEAIQGSASDFQDAIDSIDDPDAPTAEQQLDLLRRARLLHDLACWLAERVAGESGWPEGAAELIVRMKRKTEAIRNAIQQYLEEPTYDALLDIRAQLGDLDFQAFELEELVDCNNNGISDEIEIEEDPKLDSDGDGTLDECQGTGGPVGDLNGDGIVDGTDLGLLLQAWGASGENLDADLNGDGVVDGADLGLLLTNWTTPTK